MCRVQRKRRERAQSRDVPDQRGQRVALWDKNSYRSGCRYGVCFHCEAIPANIHDITVAAHLIRENDEVVYGDAGYLGIEKRPEIHKDEHLSKITYRINRRHGKPRRIKNFAGIQWEKVIEHQKSSVRCKLNTPIVLSRFNSDIKKYVFNIGGVCHEINNAL